MKISGSVTELNGWKKLVIKGTPYERGYSHGYLLHNDIKKIMDTYKYLFYTDYGLEYDFFLDVIPELFRGIIISEYKELFDEMTGIAEGATKAGTKISSDDVILINCYLSIEYMLESLPKLIREHPNLNAKYGELFSYKYSDHKVNRRGASDKCSVFIAVGNYTKNGKIVSGHNTFDNFITAQHQNILLEIHPDKGNTFMMQSSPGCIWSGSDYYVSGNGFICSESTIGGFNKFSLNAPIFCRIRKAVQYSNSLDDYVTHLTHNNSGDYANTWFIGDTNTNTIMRIELGLKYVNVDKKKNGYFIGFNSPYDPRIRNLECHNTGHYDIRRHQGARRVRLTQLMEEHKGKIDIECGQHILADHYDVYLNKINPSSRTCCSHYELDDRAFMSQDSRPKPYQPRGAVDGIVTDSAIAKKGGFVARWGSSCGTPFYAKDFFEKNIIWRDQEPYLVDRPTQPWTQFTFSSIRKKSNTNNRSRKIAELKEKKANKIKIHS